jgi:hypothetical protein
MYTEILSRNKKERFLLSMNEDRFRDEVVRPLMLRIGFKDGRDLCGSDELGKDALFILENPLGLNDIYVIQTKKGSLTMAREASKNVMEATTQIGMALKTKNAFSFDKTKRYPDRAMLCISGKINQRAKDYIIEELNDNRIIFMDADDLIPRIDEKFAELWLGIDIEIMPYLKAIKRSVEDISLSTDFLSKSDVPDAASDTMYVPLKLYRSTITHKKYKGSFHEEPKFEEIPFKGILSKKEKLFLILGEAGSGKSTSLRRLAYQIAEKSIENANNYNIPIILKASEIQNKCKDYSLVEICNEETMRLAQSSKPSFSTTDLLDGRVILMIDGLDEVPLNEQKNQVLESILDFHKNYKLCKIILTSRDYSIIKNLDPINNFIEYRISPISYKEVDLILKRFQKGKALSPESSKELLRRLQEIHGMELNPLLVTVFAATSDYARKDIPANITELFKKFTEIMLGRWDESKGLSQQFHAPLKDFVITQLGFEMHRRNATSIKLDEFRNIIQHELESRGHSANVANITEEIIYRSEIFRIVQNEVEFRHHLLQEFFAGRGIPSHDFLVSVITDEWWQRPIVFYFGENPGDSKSFKDVINSLKSMPKNEVFIAALTIGLAIQAAYLVKIDDRLELFNWVIDGLSKAKNEIFDVNDDDLPLSRFISYYLIGRDSVACSFVIDNLEKLIADIKKETNAIEELELKNFWIIISLLESQALEEAEHLIKSFKPTDLRLILAIHLSCFITSNLRVVSKEHKKIAERIISFLDKKIMPLRKQLVKEYTSELLEIRKGELKAIENGDDTIS